MNTKNHPFFFPLLKKLLVTSINKQSTDTITREVKEKIQKLSGVSSRYLDKIITKQVYTSNSGQSSVGKTTLSKLVRCLPSEWGYGKNWKTFRLKVLEELVDNELMGDIPNKDYDNIFDKNVQKRIQKEIESIAQKCLENTSHILTKTSVNQLDTDNTTTKKQNNFSYKKNLISLTQLGVRVVASVILIKIWKID